MREIEDEGYRACYARKNMVRDNPYDVVTDFEKHQAWRRGYLQCHMDENGL